MKISKQTIDLLRNFATINSNILIRPGNTLTTRTVAKSLFAEVSTDTEFPQEFGIYNLQQFLGVLTLFSDPDIEFHDDHLVISQGKNRTIYHYAAPAVLDYPERSIALPSVEVEFDLTEENLKSLLKAGSVLSSTDLKISGDGGAIQCSVLDAKNSSANTFVVDVGTTDRVFEVFIKLENMKQPSGAYKVKISSKNIVSFTNDVLKYTMIVAATKNSKWS